ncbi:unnamed protein product, partial [Adineta steineri]
DRRRRYGYGYCRISSIIDSGIISNIISRIDDAGRCEKCGRLGLFLRAAARLAGLGLGDLDDFLLRRLDDLDDGRLGGYILRCRQCGHVYCYECCFKDN